MDRKKTIPSRVILELKDGRRFATAWSPRADDRDATPLTQLFTGRLVASIPGSDEYLTGDAIDCVLEEITPRPMEDELPRIVLHRRLATSTPGNRKLLNGAAKFLDRLPGMSLERVDQIIDEPVRTWPGWDGAEVFSDGQYQVVVGKQWDNTDCVMFISVDEGDAPATSRGGSGQAGASVRRVAGTKADRRLPVPNSVAEFLDRLKEYGFVVDDSRRHYGFTHPDKPGVNGTLPRTPSDHRWADNQVSQIRQLFGIDIRQPLDD